MADTRDDVLKSTEYYSYAITVADWLQTRQIKDRDGLEEANNWVCGKQPSSDCVAAWMMTKIASIYWINNHKMLSKNYKLFFNIVYSGSNTAVVMHNYELGLEIKF